jgi:hypothetical protein
VKFATGLASCSTAPKMRLLPLRSTAGIAALRGERSVSSEICLLQVCRIDPEHHRTRAICYVDKRLREPIAKRY